MEIPEVHPLNFALKYAPPTLVMHYYIGNDQINELAHQVKVFLKENVTATQIVNELVREEPLYFGPDVVPKEQLIKLVQRLIENNGKKLGKLKLLPKNVPVPPALPAKKETVKEIVKEQPKETPPSQKEAPQKPSPPSTSSAKEALQKELRTREPKDVAPKLKEKPAQKSPEAKKSPEKPISDKESPPQKFEDFGADLQVEDIKPEINPEAKKGAKKPEEKVQKIEKSPDANSEELGSPEEAKSSGKKKRNIRERMGLGAGEAKDNDILVEDEKPEGILNFLLTKLKKMLVQRKCLPSRMKDL